MEPRYPGDVIEATRQDAEIAVEQAREVLRATLEDLRRHGYAPEDEEQRREGETVEEGEEG